MKAQEETNIHSPNEKNNETNWTFGVGNQIVTLGNKIMWQQHNKQKD